MIAKIVKGSSFKGVVNYILDREKDAKILVCDGLFAENKETITNSFEAQAGMSPKLTKEMSPEKARAALRAFASRARRLRRSDGVSPAGPGSIVDGAEDGGSGIGEGTGMPIFASSAITDCSRSSAASAVDSGVPGGTGFVAAGELAAVFRGSRFLIFPACSFSI